ncbi:hypothetical protein EVAR_29331_1 [Eumeta japonica]|uniref:Uncharacterized protein n=1 Tax=Eumeta variegata TaxID=151549 RepID=A0A4C1WJA0_EUMVA|nr:hypothetical protein EVAR_29331_1 [Eumeta japonica]
MVFNVTSARDDITVIATVNSTPICVHTTFYSTPDENANFAFVPRKAINVDASAVSGRADAETISRFVPPAYLFECRAWPISIPVPQFDVG